MIPKIIHFCWLSGDPFPADIRACLETWKEILPDYEFWLWGKKPEDCLGLNVTEKPFDVNQMLWTRQAFEARKYAFAADYLRVWAVYTYGGIYLDSDVRMYKSFNDLLDLPYFLGEDYVHCFEPAIFGAEKGCPWLKGIIEWYDGRAFTNPDGTSAQRGMPVVFHDVLCPNYKFELTRNGDYTYRPDTIRIFPSAYFNSRNYIQPIRTRESYCSHCFAGTWNFDKQKRPIMAMLKSMIPDCLLNLVYAFMHNVKYKKHMGNVIINYN